MKSCRRLALSYKVGKKEKRKKTGSVQMKVLGVQVDVEFGIRYYIPKNIAGIPIKL